MGFSVTAAHVIFAIALLGAFSVASATYWRNAVDIEEAQRVRDERAVNAAHANLTMTNNSWSGAASTYTFNVTNTGSTTLDITKLSYMFDGTITFATQVSGFPRLNGVNPVTSDLLLPGDVLECKFSLGAQPSYAQVTGEFGVTAHYPG